MNWDAFQRETLDALGHTLYRMAGAEAPVSSHEAEPPIAGTAALTPLQRAVLRATGRRDATDDALRPMLTVAHRLRADPAAKRALWPRLRALRRESGR